jgi:hypothetical protein
MPNNAYVLHSTWRVPGDVQTVYDVVSDADNLAEWWPSGFLRVTVLERGDEDGLGKLLEVVTKGWLPYTILWRQRVTAVDEPWGFTIDVEGDFAGRGVWSFRQDGENDVVADFDWRISATKPLLRVLSPLLKPVFAWNHRWVMARGEESLRLEVQRRSSPTPEARAAIPLPPGPTWPHRRRHPGDQNVGHGPRTMASTEGR